MALSRYVYLNPVRTTAAGERPVEGEGEDETGRLLKSSALAVGGGFVDWIRGQLIERGRRSQCAEDTALRTLVRSLPVDRVLEVTADMLGVKPEAFRERRRNSDLRSIAARLLGRHAGLTQREAAAALGMKTGAAAGQQIRRLETGLSADRSLRHRLTDIESALTRESGS